MKNWIRANSYDQWSKILDKAEDADRSNVRSLDYYGDTLEDERYRTNEGSIESEGF